MADPQLNLKVNVTGAQQGAGELNKVAQATDKVGGAAGNNAKDVKSLGEALAGLGRGNNDAKDVLEGINAAAKGGAGAFFGLAKSARAAFAIFTGGGAALAAGALGLAGTAAIALASALLKPKKSAEELKAEADKVKESLEAAKREAEALNKQRLDTLVADLDAIDASAKRAIETFTLLQQKAQEVDDAQRGLQLAEVANSNLSAEQRVRAEAEINARFDARKRSRDVGSEQFTLEQAVQRNRAVQSEETEAVNALNAARANEERLKARQAASLAQTEEAFRQEGLGRPGFDGTRRRFEEAKKEIETQTAEGLARARADVVGAEQQLLKVNERAKKTLDDRLAAEEKFRISQEKRKELAPIEQQRAEIENRKRLDEASKSDAERAKARQAQLDELGRRAEEAYARGDNAAQDEAVAERNKLLRESRIPALTQPTAKLETFAPRAKRDDVAKPLEEAAQEIKAEPPLDARPIEEASQGLAAAVAANNTQSQEAIVGASGAIAQAATALPAPVDLNPLLNAFSTYDGTVKTKFADVETQIEAITLQIQQLGQQLANSRR